MRTIVTLSRLRASRLRAGRLGSRSERGASAVEYGLLAAGIAGVMVVALFLFGDMVLDVFTDSCDHISSSVPGDCT